MSWENLQVSFYRNHFDTTGEAVTLRDALYCKFYTGLDAIVEMRSLDPALPDYDKRKKSLKDTLPLFSPSALLATREQGKIEITSRTGLIQFDFDNCYEYDIDELKQAIFALPFVAWVGLSCSGNGIYALAMIAEPDRQRAYVMHCFEIFKQYGLPIDTSKGRNAHDLRYISYDSRPLWRDNPEPLRIKHFKAQERPQNKPVSNGQQFAGSRNALVKKAMNEISAAQVGQRWATIQKWSYTLGGLQDKELLNMIEQAITANPAFDNMEAKYMKCAADCFNAGTGKPLPQSTPIHPKS